VWSPLDLGRVGATPAIPTTSGEAETPRTRRSDLGWAEGTSAASSTAGEAESPRPSLSCQRVRSLLRLLGRPMWWAGLSPQRLGLFVFTAHGIVSGPAMPTPLTPPI
jgi:hypothetical protein